MLLQPISKFAQVFRRLGILLLLYLVVLSVSRLLLIALHFDRVSGTSGLGFILAQGVRFDIILAGMIFGPVALFKPWFHLAPVLSQLGRWLVPLYVGVMTSLAFFVEASTSAFIAEFDTRPNYLFVEYLQYPDEIFATVVGERPLSLALFTLAAALMGLYAARWLHRDPAWDVRVSPVVCVAGMPIIALLTVAMVRSTLDHRPVNASVAAFSQDSLVNQLPLNSPYTVIYALYERQRDAERNSIRYGDLPADEVVDIIQTEAGIEQGDLLHTTLPTLRYQQATAERERPLNLVIVLEESIGAKHVGSLGGLDLTPEFDSLASEGIFFERLYATGMRSVRGIEAVLTCITPRAQLSVVKLNETQRDFFTIASLLEGHGYHTSFIYGGESHFDNMKRFFLGNGFQTVVDQDDYDDPVFEGPWGVSDEDLFNKAQEIFSGYGDEPFFSLVFTSSNHAPFDIPEGRVEASEHGPRETAIRYADYALGEFIDAARESDYWDNTVFLVVADHSVRIHGAALVPVNEFRIPGVIVGGTIEPQRIPGITSQIDLLPTLLSLIGLSAAHPCIGRDVTLPEYAAGAGRAAMQFHDLQAYLEGERVVVLQPDLPAKAFEMAEDGEKTLIPEGDAPLERKALAYALWGPMAIREKLYFNHADSVVR